MFLLAGPFSRNKHPQDKWSWRQDGDKMAHDSHKRPQHSPKRLQDGPRMTSRGLQTAGGCENCIVKYDVKRNSYNSTRRCFLTFCCSYLQSKWVLYRFLRYIVVPQRSLYMAPGGSKIAARGSLIASGGADCTVKYDAKCTSHHDRLNMFAYAF